MKSESQTWKDIASAYLRAVEQALSKVDHPRRGEVLENLRAHLEESYNALPPDKRTPQDLHLLVESMGPPEDYAILLSETPASPPRRALLRLAVLCLAVALISVLLYAIFWVNTDVRGVVLNATGANWSAPPFFNKAGFARITPGMTADEVRDAIGYPLSRYSVVGREDESRWEFTTVAYNSASSYNSYTVVFSRTSGKVLRTEKQGVITDGVLPRPVWSMTIEGDFTLTASDGSSKVLRKSDPNTYLIVPYSDGYKTIERSVGVTTEHIQRLTGSLKPGGVEVLHLYSGRRSEEFSAYVSEFFTATSPSVPRDPSYYGFVYKAGEVYFLPLVYSGSNADVWRQDQEWLVKKLSSSRGS